MQESLYTKGVVKIGVVAYAPKVVTIWEGIKEYLRSQGFNADYVLYSNYPALVEALVARHVDIAWNTPLAYLQVKEKLGGQCQVLAMRDTDLGFTTVFITQTDSPIRSLVDLNGKRFAVASRDSSHAAILPLYFLHQNGIHPDKDLTLLRFDTDGRCDLRSCTGNDGRGMAESLFHGTRLREGRVVEALGAEVMEIVDGKIKEIRDYHRPVPAKAA